MKNLIIISALLLCASVSFGQFPITQSIGSKNTQVTTQGALASDSGYVYRYNFPDTATVNLGWLDGIPGITIRIDDVLWKRNNSATRWDKIGTNIYIENGTQTDALRQYDFNGGTLKFIDNGSIIIGDAPQQSVSVAKLQVVNSPRQPVVSFGNLPVDGIPIAMFQTDTITSANLASQTGRWAQIHRNLYVSDNGLTLTDRSSTFLHLGLNARDSVRLHSVGGDLQYANRTSITFGKFPGHTSRTVYQGGTVDVDAVPAQLSYIATTGSTSSTNNIRLRGFWSGTTSYLNLSNVNDTIDHFIAFESNGFVVGKALKWYGLYMAGVVADSIWSVYSPYAAQRFYQRGPASFGTTGSGPVEAVEIGGRIKIVDGNQASGKVLTSDANGVGTWQAAGAGSVTWNTISNPTGSQSLTFDDGEISAWTNGSNTEVFLSIPSNSLTSGTTLKIATSSMTDGNLIDLSSSSTALAFGNELLAMSMSGANASSGITATAQNISVTNTGTNSTNIGLNITTSDGTYNYDIFANGKISVGAASIAAGATAWDGSATLAMFRMLDNSWGGITVYNNANYATALTIAAQGIATNQDLLFNALGGDMMFNMARVKIGNNVNATAHLHIVASTTAANTGQIKFDEGSALTTPEDGTLNYVSNNLQFTETSTVYTLAKTLTNTATLDFDLTAVNYQDLTITVTGAAVNDAVSISVDPGALVADVTYFATVTATNTVTIRCSRVGGGGAANPGSGTFRASVIHY